MTFCFEKNEITLLTSEMLSFDLYASMSDGNVSIRMEVFFKVSFWNLIDLAEVFIELHREMLKCCFCS